MIQISQILGNRLIEPFFYEYNLNGQRYLSLLQNHIIPAIRNIVPEDQLNNVWFQQDGCPAHNSRNVQEYLSEVFDERIISNNGAIPWPARSPDLTPLDFYLWGYIKNEIYEFEPPENVHVLRARSEDIFNSINRNTLRRVTGTVLKKCQNCIDANGGHFED